MHTSVPLQLPQFKVPPQPSERLPQVALWAAQVVGVHGMFEQTLAVSDPQTFLGPHAPQSSVPLQPSEIVPHCAPSAAQVVGTQAPSPH